MLNPWTSCIRVIKAIESHSAEALIQAGINKAVIACMESHRKGDYLEAQQLYSELDFASLDSKNHALAQADSKLLKVKMGTIQAQDLATITQSYAPAKVIELYARFSMYFWLDHKKAWQTLGSMWKQAVWLCSLAYLTQCLFLIGHLLAIRGWARPGISMALMGYKLATARRHVSGQESFFLNIVFTAFPYTHIVAGKFGKRFEEAASQGERMASCEPYYRALLTISCLYGYAYGQDVSRAEVYAEDLNALHKSGKLLRYKQLSKLMPLLPLALRGYAQAAEHGFNEIMAQYQEAEESHLMNSQFYRVAAVIALHLNRNHEAHDFIKKAIHYRQATNSFHSWQSVDENIEFYATSHRSMELLNEQPLFKAPIASKDAKQSALMIAKISSAFAQNQHLSNTDMEVHIASLIRTLTKADKFYLLDMNSYEDRHLPMIKIGQHFYVFTLRNDYIAKTKQRFMMVDPVLRMLFLSKEHQAKRLKMSYLEDLSKEVFQIAHDIKSPLTSLIILNNALTHIEPTRKKILNDSIQSITTISSELLKKHHQFKHLHQHQQTSPTVTPELPVEKILFVNEIKRIVNQKRFELQKRQLRCVLDIDTHTKAAIVECNPSRLARGLSNIINNAADAAPKDSVITIRIFQDRDQIYLSVIDKGCGIPVETLSRVKEYGFSTGKNQGHGLGLAQVHQFVNSAGGDLEISSHEHPHAHQGTNVTIALPLLKDTAITGEVTVQSYDTVVIADNDLSLRESLYQKVQEATNDANFIKTFADLESLTEYHDETPLEEHHVLLLDYDFNDQDCSGLDWLHRFYKGKQAYLVSSHWSTPSIMQACKERGIKIIPKDILNDIYFSYTDMPHPTVKSRRSYDG